MSKQARPDGSEIFEQAIKNYQEAMEAGVKLQQDAARWWMDTMGKAGSTHEWQAKATQMASDSASAIQKRFEENLKHLETSSRTSIDLLKKAMDAAKVDTVSAGQAKLQELWEASLQAMRANASAIQQANAKWMETCMQFVSKASPAA